MPDHYTLTVLPERLSIVRLVPDTPLPNSIHKDDNLLAYIQTRDELTMVCNEKYAPPADRIQRGLRAIKVEGPLDLSLVGVLASLLSPLSTAGVSVFTISTFDTDYILVQEGVLQTAVTALKEAGHIVKTKSLE
jgi:hypothetical protein